jgi:hypothetical protein
LDQLRKIEDCEERERDLDQYHLSGSNIVGFFHTVGSREAPMMNTETTVCVS